MTKQTHPNLPQHRYVKPTMQEGERNGVFPQRAQPADSADEPEDAPDS